MGNEMSDYWTTYYGSFKNYVDKMRGGKWSKMPIIVHFQEENVNVEVDRWSKKSKIMFT